jgi:predicted nucleotide-binding protein
MKSAIKR